MDYPRAFIFVDKDTPLPTLDALQKLFQVERADNLYVQGMSPSDDEVDCDLKIMTYIHRYAMESEQSLRCVVVSTTEIGIFANTHLSQHWRGIAWIDSEEDAANLSHLSTLISNSYDLNDSIHNAIVMHSRFVNNLENIEDELGIYAPEALSEFEQQIFDAQFELSQRLDRLINQLTHPGARSRPELSNQLPNQAAA
ncbi:MAG: hypothetical protein EBV34_17875 [Betaproteobacteria bacterium]|nr:hypothetical protein [Betaproteobacteria bacterium]NDE54778.1 hypothetical protein [Actinomycetota bacterium]